MRNRFVRSSAQSWRADFGRRRCARLKSPSSPRGGIEGRSRAGILALQAMLAVGSLPLAITPGRAAERGPCAVASAVPGSRAPAFVRVAGVPAADVIELTDGRSLHLRGIAAPRDLGRRAPQAGEFAAKPADQDATDDAADDAASGEADASPDLAPDAPADITAGLARPAPAAPASADDPSAAWLEAARAALSRLVLGREIVFRPLTATPDRFGRIPAAAAEDAQGRSLHLALVGAGLARVIPVATLAEAACIRALLAREAEARAAGRGLWADPAFAVRQAADPDLAAHAGSYQIVEGLVRSVGYAAARHYLNFGTNFRSDFTVVIGDKERDRFAAAGFDPARLSGREVRVRGMLLARDGGLMTLTVPEEIEWTR